MVSRGQSRNTAEVTHSLCAISAVYIFLFKLVYDVPQTFSEFRACRGTWCYCFALLDPHTLTVHMRFFFGLFGYLCISNNRFMFYVFLAVFSFCSSTKNQIIHLLAPKLSLSRSLLSSLPNCCRASAGLNLPDSWMTETLTLKLCKSILKNSHLNCFQLIKVFQDQHPLRTKRYRKRLQVGMLQQNAFLTIRKTRLASARV